MKKNIFLIITILFVIIGNSFAQYDMDYMQLMNIGYYHSVSVSSFDIDGEYYCLGRDQESYNGYDNVGEADIWKLNTDGFWEQIATLHANDYAEDDFFGNDVKISGDYVYVAAKDEDADGYSDAGSVYVFKNDGNDNFTQIAKILNPFPASGDRFGSVIDVQEDYLVVGCHGDDGTYYNEGSAYVFKKDASDNYSYIATLKGDLGEEYFFGYSVAINGNYIIVGAYGEDYSGLNMSGSAYVFKNDGSDNFSRVAKLIASDAEEEDHFGYSVDVEGNYVVVGAPDEDAGGVSGAGSVYVYKNDGSDNFTQIVKLHEDPFIGGSLFGKDVQISNDTIYVTSENATYIFKNNGSDVYNYIYKLEDLGDDNIDIFSYQDKKLIVSERYSNYRYIKFYYFDNPEVVQSPSDKDNLCGDASLFMQAQSRFAKEYQWQISTDGGNNYTDLSDDATYYGTTGKTLGINYNNSLSGNFYRCKFINPYGTSYSDAATLYGEIEVPVLSCQDYDLYLNSEGKATLKETDVVTSASDNCGLGDTLLSQTLFDCSYIGRNTVTVTLKDINDNSVQQDIDVSIIDTIKPAISIPDNLHAIAASNNKYVVNGTEFDPTVSDNCGVSSVTNDLNNSNTLANEELSVGTTTVVWTVEDESGNQKVYSSEITIYEYGTSIDESKELETNLYPNPTNGIFTIDLSNIEAQKVKVINSTGKEIMELPAENLKMQIDLSKFPSGIYTLKIQTEDGMKVEKIIKQ